MLTKIAFGGGCHWCTEAVFQALKGVIKVEQGYVASTGINSDLSEAVIVYYNTEIIPLSVLIIIHLLTHKSTSNHSFRSKYRSAVYFINSSDERLALEILENLQNDFDKPIITQVLAFKSFVASRESLHNYYAKNPDRPFCKRYINPKLNLLRNRYAHCIAEV